MADRGGLSLQPDSLYHAIAGVRPGTGPDTLRTDTLRAGRDKIPLDTAVDMRQRNAYDNGDFVKVALAPDIHENHQRTEPLSTDPGDNALHAGSCPT